MATAKKMARLLRGRFLRGEVSYPVQPVSDGSSKSLLGYRVHRARVAVPRDRLRLRDKALLEPEETGRHEIFSVEGKHDVGVSTAMWGGCQAVRFFGKKKKRTQLRLL